MAMSQKGFLVKVELDIQKITCPGVWLCSNGKVSLQVHMLDSSIQTASAKPVFPIHCNEKFVFYKTFRKDRRLNELQRSLNNQWFYAELIQWQSCDEGCVLATFQATMDELLYPTSFRGSITGMDIDLLMEPTNLFPGTLAPKLEVSTKTTIEETFYDLDNEQSIPVVGNPKILVSARSPTRKSHPRKVCHSVGFSRAQKNVPLKKKKTRPIFQYRKVDDDLILRNNPNLVMRNDEFVRNNEKSGRTKVESVCPCYCSFRSRSMESIPNCSKVNCKRWPPDNIKKCCLAASYGKVHTDDCSICSKYEVYFAPIPAKMPTVVCSNFDDNERVEPKLCSYCKQMQTRKYHIIADTSSPSGSEVSEGSKRRVCFCLSEEKTKSLAQHLHQKLTQTLDSNNKFFQNCINCSE